MRECDNSKIHIRSNFLLSVCLIIMLDTLLLIYYYYLLLQNCYDNYCCHGGKTFFFPNVSTCLLRLCGLFLPRLWLKCNRLLRLGRTVGAVTLSR